MHSTYCQTQTQNSGCVLSDIRRRKFQLKTEVYVAISYMKEAETRIIQNPLNPMKKFRPGDW